MWDKDRVRNLRRKLEMTQSEFAAALGCRQQTVSEWEIGLYAPANAYGRLLDRMDQTAVAGPVKTTVSPMRSSFNEQREFDPALD